MIVKVAENLFIGDMDACERLADEAVIHACKTPCFPARVPDFNVVETELDLYLKIIDPDKPMFTPDLFIASIRFIKKHIKERNVVIHCNKGQSRSASIAMLYLFGKETYRDAQDMIEEIYPYYQPSLGIDIYLENNWKILTA